MGGRYVPPYPPSYGLNSTTTVLLGEWLWRQITYEGWYAIKQRNQTDCFVVSQLFSVARHVGHLKLGLKPAQLYVRSSIITLSQLANHDSPGIIRHYVIAFVCLHFCLSGYQSAQFIRRALHYAIGSRTFLRQSAQPLGGCVYTHTHMYTYVYGVRYKTMLRYTSSVMYRKRSFGVSLFQHQTPSLCWPRLRWLDPDVHTTNLLHQLPFWT